MFRHLIKQFKKPIPTHFYLPMIRSYHSRSSNINILNNFFQQYFHRYQFLVYGRLDLEEFSSRLFDAKPIRDKDSKIVKIEVSPKFDPTIALLTKITNLDKLQMGFNVYPTHDKALSIISPTGLMPTHFSLRFRDAVEEQRCRTVTQMADIRNHEKAKIVKDPFSFKLDFSEIPDNLSKTEKPDTYENIKSFIFPIEKDDVTWKNEINNILTNWSQLTSEKQQQLIDSFYQSYYLSYYPSLMRFNVLDKKWNAYNGLNILSDTYNKASQFMEFSQYRHSLISQISLAYITDGGFSLNHYCPGVDFLSRMGREVSRTDVSLRKAHSCIPYNGFIPYWMMVYLKETFEAFEIPTSSLQMPLEMSEAIERGSAPKKHN